MVIHTPSTDLNKKVLAFIEQYEKEYEKQAHHQRRMMRDVVDNIQVECLTIVVNSVLQPIQDKIELQLKDLEEMTKDK